MQPLTPFHIAVQVRNLDEARKFYREVLGCPEGRSAEQWVDFDLYGHQFVCHLKSGIGTDRKSHRPFQPGGWPWSAGAALWSSVGIG